MYAQVVSRRDWHQTTCERRNGQKEWVLIQLSSEWTMSGMLASRDKRGKLWARHPTLSRMNLSLRWSKTKPWSWFPGSPRAALVYYHVIVCKSYRWGNEGTGKGKATFLIHVYRHTHTYFEVCVLQRKPPVDSSVPGDFSLDYQTSLSLHCSR